VEGDKRYYFDYTGCGNTLNVRHPRVLQLIMDSLRYWITEMHVDGFRFDLASTLARTFYEVDKLSAFFDIIHQDPVISQVKLIAEPWDLGSGGYQVGNFPVLWTEWNGKYRDSIRGFWNGKGVTLSDLATRLVGSYDLYAESGRQPHASINFVTCHDGFTLRDLVSYNDKHNDANGEGGNDGNNHNASWNCGHEGETDNEDIIEFRRRQMCNMLATLFLSTGVPMLNGGDELVKTCFGNNNTYCQDRLNWFDWDLHSWPYKEDVLALVKRLIKIRHKQPVLHRRKYTDSNIKWVHPDGREFSAEEWHNPANQCLGYIMDGTSIQETSESGKRIEGETLLVLINAQFHDVQFTLPINRSGNPWRLLLSTSRNVKQGHLYEFGEKFPLQDHSISVFSVFIPKKVWFKQLKNVVE
jgi:glycogen operon protein